MQTKNTATIDKSPATIPQYAHDINNPPIVAITIGISDVLPATTSLR